MNKRNIIPLKRKGLFNILDFERIEIGKWYLSYIKNADLLHPNFERQLKEYLDKNDLDIFLESGYNIPPQCKFERKSKPKN